MLTERASLNLCYCSFTFWLLFCFKQFTSVDVRPMEGNGFSICLFSYQHHHGKLPVGYFFHLLEFHFSHANRYVGAFHCCFNTHSLMTNDAEPPFLCWFATCIFGWLNYPILRGWLPFPSPSAHRQRWGPVSYTRSDTDPSFTVYFSITGILQALRCSCWLIWFQVSPETETVYKPLCPRLLK